MPFTQPPGFLSPAAFPFQSILPNDAPVVTPQPYLISQNTIYPSGVSITLKVITPTNTGDAIVVAGWSASQTVGGSCTDTKGNTYSLVVASQTASRSGMYVARNPVPLGVTDSITYTFATNAGGTKIAAAIGLPVTALTSSSGSYLTWDIFNSTTNSTGSLKLTVPSSAGAASPGVPELVVALCITPLAAGPPQFSQNWNIISTQLDIVGTDYFVMAYQNVTGITSSSTLAYTNANVGGNYTLMAVSFRPETRFSSSQPYPLTPPGNLSPGSWQNAALPRSFNTLNNVTLPGNTVNDYVTSLAGNAIASMVNPVSSTAISSLPGSLSTLISGTSASVTSITVTGLIQELMNGSSSAISVASVFGSLSELMLVPTAAVTDSAPAGSSSITVQSVVADNLVATINGSLSELMSGVIVNISSAGQPGSITLIAQGDTSQVLVDPVSGESYTAFYLTGMPATVNVLSEPGTSEIIHSYLGIPAVVTNESLAGTLEILAIPGVAHWYGRLIINN